MSITVSIVEDVTVTRENLAAMVNRADGMRCVSTYGTGEAALRGIPIDVPDVALVDINLPGINGIEVVSNLKARMPELEILMLTTYQDRDMIFNSLRAGAKGYVLKSVPPAELISAIEQIHSGGAPMSAQIARKVVDFFGSAQKSTDDVEKLTQREHEVLTLLAQGYFYKEISDRLDIGMSTVRTHVRHIYEKLQVQSRTEATLKFLGKE